MTTASRVSLCVDLLFLGVGFGSYEHKNNIVMLPYARDYGQRSYTYVGGGGGGEGEGEEGEREEGRRGRGRRERRREALV